MINTSERSSSLVAPEPRYVLKSVTATCFIVPASLRTSLSASTIVVDVAEVFPSIILSSAVVTVTPSRIFNSPASAVTFVPPISKVVKLTSPATVTIPLARVNKSVSPV